MIGSLAGVLVGFWFAASRRSMLVFDPYVKMINALPRVVLAPIFALWFGLGIASKVALGFTLVFFIVFFNVYQGVKEVSPTVLPMPHARHERTAADALTSIGLPRSPGCSLLHTSVGFAVVGAVVGEYLGSAAGLGHIIQQAEGVFDVAGVFAGMFVLAVFVIVIETAVTMIEMRLLVWRPVASMDARYCPEWAEGGFHGRNHAALAAVELVEQCDHRVDLALDAARAPKVGLALGERLVPHVGLELLLGREVPVLRRDRGAQQPDGVERIE